MSDKRHFGLILINIILITVLLISNLALTGAMARTNPISQKSEEIEFLRAAQADPTPPPPLPAKNKTAGNLGTKPKFPLPGDFSEEDEGGAGQVQKPPRPERNGTQLQSSLMVKADIDIKSFSELQRIQDLGYPCQEVGLCSLELSQDEASILKVEGFPVVITDQAAVITFGDEDSESPLVEEYQYAANINDYYIPDYDGSCGWNYSWVEITDAPPGAVVSRVEYSARVVHTYPGDLVIYIYNDQATYDWVVWNRLGGDDDGGYDDDLENDDDVYLNVRPIDAAFDGNDVNQFWYFLAYDCATADTGYIDYYNIWVYYETSGEPNLTPYTPNGWDYPIVPSSISGTHTVDDLYANQATYIDWAVVNDGNADIPETFYYCLYYDGNPLQYWFSEGFSQGYYAYVEDWILNLSPTVGWHTLKIVSDVYNDVTESNESDNEWSHNFYWDASPSAVGLIFLPAIFKDYSAPIFYDPFDTDKSWTIISSGGYDYEIFGGEYYITQTLANRNVKSIAPVTSAEIPSQYVIEADMRLPEGSNDETRYGLVFDFVDANRFYVFYVSPKNQQWWIYKFNSGWSKIDSSTSANTNTNQTGYNHLKLERNGAQIKAYVNGDELGPWSPHSDFTGNQAGVILLTSSTLPSGENAVAAYDDFLITYLYP